VPICGKPKTEGHHADYEKPLGGLKTAKQAGSAMGAKLRASARAASQFFDFRSKAGIDVPETEPVNGFHFQLEKSSLGDCPSAPVARAMLKRSISREFNLRLTTTIINL
jgi:hypothetical protein